MPRLGLLASLALTGLASALAAQGSGSPRCSTADRAVVAGELGRKMHEYASRLAALGVFQGSVLVARGDTVLLWAGFGLVDQRRCIPVTRSTLFDIGSVSKTFAAAAILSLEVQGRLTTDDSLGRFFPGVPQDKQSVTVHQLLTHTSGLPGDLEPAGARVTAANDPRLADRLLALPLATIPGSTFRYSNAGYALLRLIVERASGQSYQAYVRERLLLPAGMRSTGWHGDSALLRPGVAARGAWGLYDSGSPRDWPLLGAAFGGGQMVSTVGDLFRWMRALHTDQLLPDQSRRRLFTPMTRWAGPGADARGVSAQYAYGWEVRARADGSTALVFHNGTFDNFRTTLRGYPQDDIVIAVTNHVQLQDAGDRADEVANALRDLTRGDTVALPPATIRDQRLALARLAGRYDEPSGGSVELWRHASSRLWIAPHGQRSFDAIWRPDSARAATNARVASRTLQVVDSLRRTPCGPDADGWSRMLCDLSARHGPIEQVELEGVAPLTWSRDWSLSYTTLRFARGTQVITWEWRQDQLVRTLSDDSVRLPQSVPLARMNGQRWVMYDWFTGRSVFVEVGTAGRAGDPLRIVSGDSAFVAVRRPAQSGSKPPSN